MNKEQRKQSGIEIGILPDLIKNKKAFEALVAVQGNEHKRYVGRYRRLLYAKMKESLGVNAPRQSVSYRKWFGDPETHVNDAFLDRERRNTHRWLMIVNAMNFALTETLMVAVEETNRHLEFYKERNKHLSSALDSYLKSQDNAD